MNMKQELIAAKKALWGKRRECAELREELRKTKLALDAAKYAMDVLEQHAKEREKTNRFLKDKLARLHKQTEEAQSVVKVLIKDSQEYYGHENDLKDENARLREELRAAQEARAYPVDVDPIMAEKLREENKLLREELKVKETWIVDLIEKIREFRAETEELAEVTGTQRGQDAEGALKVIAEVARKFFEKYEVQA